VKGEICARRSKQTEEFASAQRERRNEAVIREYDWLESAGREEEKTEGRERESLSLIQT
jgi:hypothetical protein